MAHVQQFSYLLNKFEVWVSFEAVCNILDRFFSLIFQNEIQSFARLQSLKLVCFILWKLCRFMTFFDKTNNNNNNNNLLPFDIKYNIYNKNTLRLN